MGYCELIHRPVDDGEIAQIHPVDEGPLEAFRVHARYMSRFTRELADVEWPQNTSYWRQRGITRHMLAGPRWSRVARDLYRPIMDPPLTPAQRIVDVAAALPAGAAIAGWAAAYVHGVDMLDGCDDFNLLPLPICVRMPPGFHRRSTDEIRYVQPARSITIHQASGLPVTPLRIAAIDMARWASELTEAVGAVDAVLGSKLLNRGELLDAADNGGPGSRQVRQAVEFCREGVRSPWESRLRMFWVIELELPMPLVNPPVFDVDGNFLGMPDLLDDEAGLAMEYDGSRWRSTDSAGHRDRDQHRRDNHREEGFERTNLVVVRADKVDLTRERRKLASRLRAARSDGMRRDRTRDRWTLQEPPGWWGLPA